MNNQDFYSIHSQITAPEEYGVLFDGLPDDISNLCQAVQGMLLHIHWADRYGVGVTEAYRPCQVIGNHEQVSNSYNPFLKAEKKETEINTDLFAPCGLYCGVCGVYMASRDNNQKLKDKFAAHTLSPQIKSHAGGVCQMKNLFFVRSAGFGPVPPKEISKDAIAVTSFPANR